MHANVTSYLAMIRHDAALQEKSPPLVEKEKRNLNINAAIARGGGAQCSGGIGHCAHAAQFCAIKSRGFCLCSDFSLSFPSEKITVFIFFSHPHSVRPL